MTKNTIGILTSRTGNNFQEPVYFRRLILEGKKLGATVFLFSPQDVLSRTRQVYGYVPSVGKGWRKIRFPWPDIVIDRYRYYPVPQYDEYLPFRRRNLFFYANSRFSNKWSVHQVLSQDEEMKRWLPESVEYSHARLEEMFARHPILYIKPTNGSGGRSILRIERRENGIVLRGRTKTLVKKTATVKTMESLYAWVDEWTTSERRGKESFFVQQGLNLDLLPDRAVDIRLLIQKDEKGDWDITGLGARIGQRHSSTSNLHGGGKAEPAQPFLAKRFGREQAEAILDDCGKLAHLTVEKIEHHYGQMVEFGLDIGVDVNGRVWLIEVNPKPGREIFRQIGQMDRYQLAIRRPLQCALYMLKIKKAERDLLG
jgi:glutathione synthase/RimK-type ligase-like ATP-grasp enzyme